jgi:hypothetical protein
LGAFTLDWLQGKEREREKKKRGLAYVMIHLSPLIVRSNEFELKNVSIVRVYNLQKKHESISNLNHIVISAFYV